MLLYNITLKVDHSIQGAWLPWMRKSFIPSIMDTGHFEDFQFYELLHLPDQDGKTYALQLFCLSIQEFRTFQMEEEQDLQFLLVKKFEDRVVFFPTLMKTVG